MLNASPNRTWVYAQRWPVPLTDDSDGKMLRGARMAGLGKLRCGIGHIGERRLWAVREDGPIV